MMIIGFCNPLLDISCQLKDDHLLQKYGLKPNDAVLAGPAHHSLLADLHTMGLELHYSAGGAGQNAMRAAQWLLPPNSVLFMGAVGQDSHSNTLQEAAKQDGLAVNYMQMQEEATGTCICLLTAGHRSLVASLNAATKFDATHLQSNVDLLTAADAFYISGFLLSDAFSVPCFVVDFSIAHHKQVFMNLSAPFICEFYLERVKHVIAACSVVFGNETEARTLAKAAGFANQSDILEIARELAYWELQSNQRPRLVVITQGSDCTVCFDTSSMTTCQFNVPKIPVDDIVDTNGAGDAFVGAFLSQYLQGRSLSNCVHAGHTVAQIVIKQSGVVFPANEKPHFIH